MPIIAFFFMKGPFFSLLCFVRLFACPGVLMQQGHRSTLFSDSQGREANNAFSFLITGMAQPFSLQMIKRNDADVVSNKELFGVCW